MIQRHQRTVLLLFHNQSHLFLVPIFHSLHPPAIIEYTFFSHTPIHT